jgi:opacity protein-like surface antigen
VRHTLTFPIAVLGLLAGPTTVLAQPAARPVSVQVRALGGVTFAHAGGDVFAGLSGLSARGGVVWNGAGAMAGAAAGLRFPQAFGLVGFAELGHLTNAMPRDLQRVVDGLLGVSSTEGFPEDFEFSVKLPATYRLAGVRKDFPRPDRWTPYLEGGVGHARVRADVRLIVAGQDFSQGFVEFVAEQGQTLEDSGTLWLFGGGFSYPLAAGFSLDLGGRLFHIAAGDPITKGAAQIGLVWTSR